MQSSSKPEVVLVRYLFSDLNYFDVPRLPGLLDFVCGECAKLGR
jgi:hypothetical protein